jgi:hypothetical protein
MLSIDPFRRQRGSMFVVIVTGAAVKALIWDTRIGRMNSDILGRCPPR